jgi:hypothetical protein
MFPTLHIVQRQRRHRLALRRLILLGGAMLGLTVNGCAAQSSPPETPPQISDAVTDWPVVSLANEGRIEVYQPQPQTMKGNMLTARAVVSLSRSDTTPPEFGTAWFTAHVITDRDTRIVTLADVTVSDVRIPGSTPDQQRDFATAISGRLSSMEVTFPLDQLMTSLDTAKCENVKESQIQTTPPHIVFSTSPATLISVNGPAKLEPVDQVNGVSRVANTPFILLLNDASRTYYLKAGSRWVSAGDLTGQWTDTTNVPPAVATAAEQLVAPPPNTTAPAAPTAADIAPAAADAKIIVATEPTELIVTSGNPQFAPIPGGAGGELLYATNTASDLFLDQSDHRYYVVLSGRWYAATAFDGPWQYVASDHLPAAFAQIPADSPKASVLSFVAGTNESHEAVLDAGIPQTASIRRDAGADLNVAYDGDPKFQDVAQSQGVAYALNTPEEVLRVNGKYYCCHQAVWYESDTPTGPWTVCVAVPQAIYTLPPSCPDYNVRYCYVYDYYPDYVTCGYLPGYTGTYIYGPSIVYGTGYDYPGWYGSAYFPPPCTWGFAAYYDPFACAWGFDTGLYWGGVSWYARPYHERWWRDHPHEHWAASRWWGQGGFVHSHEIRGQLVHARSGPGSATGWNNIYARHDNAARNISVERQRALTTAGRASGTRDNLFSGSDGSVFRRSDTGWEQYHHAEGTWTRSDNVPEASPTYHPQPNNAYGYSFDRPEAGLDQHYAARSMGGDRAATIHSFGGGESTGGGFHGGGGGGFHGGGGGGHR